mgnify:CR=1 FL=1
MSVTAYSFLMSLLCSDLFILLLYLSRKKKLLAGHDGILLISVLYALTFIRLFMPVEFSFVKIIHAPSVFNSVQTAIRHSRPVAGLSLGTLLLIGWFFVAFLLIGKHLILYNLVMRKLLLLPAADNARYSACLKKINSAYKKKIHVTFRISKITNIPMGFGIRKKIILLPCQDYSDENLYYIFVHECNHFYNHDILVKLLTKLFCCLFWWNPVVYLLKAELENTLEIKCDLTSTAILDKPEKIQYLETIVAVLKQSIAGPKILFRYSTALFRSDRKQLLPERMTVITKNKFSKQNFMKACILAVSFCIIYIGSYLAVFQPYIPLSETQQIEMNILPANEGAAFICADPNGNYYYVLAGTDIKVNISKKDAEAYLKAGIELKEEGYQ